MRNFEERKAEVFRRSENRIKERKRKLGYMCTAGIPICLIGIILSVISFPGNKAEKNVYMIPEKVEGNDMCMSPESVEGNDMYMYLDGANTGAACTEDGSDKGEEMLVSFISCYIRTDGYQEEVEYPVVKIIRSVSELNEYYNANKEKYDLERKDEVYSDTTIGFLDACDKYDEAYFENQILIMVLLEEGSGSVRHKVDSVKVGWDEKLYININSIVPEEGTCDMAQWHILIEPENGVDVANETEVIVDIHAEYQ